MKTRVDEVNSNEHAFYIRINHNPLYNFEYFMNRPYTYNRDKGKCVICGGFIEPNEAHIHHIKPKLPNDQRNKVKNLITVHPYCHNLIHNEVENENLSEKTRKRLAKYRKLLKEAVV